MNGNGNDSANVIRNSPQSHDDKLHVNDVGADFLSDVFHDVFVRIHISYRIV